RNGFCQQLHRIWFRCLRRRNQKGRRMDWLEPEILTAPFTLHVPHITRTA
ncbi:group II intron reverse transcriptase/maturase, partial [Rhizobium sp. L9]